MDKYLSIAQFLGLSTPTLHALIPFKLNLTDATLKCLSLSQANTNVLNLCSQFNNSIYGNTTHLVFVNDSVVIHTHQRVSTTRVV